jgi:hypothetical protein
MEYGQAERRDYLTEIQAAHTQQEMKIQQAEEARKKADFDRKNELIDIDTYKKALGENTFGVLKTGAEALGFIKYVDTPTGKKGFIRREDAAHMPTALKTNNELRTAASSAKLADLTIQRQDYDDQISKLTEKGGKEAEIIKLTKDRDALSGNISKFVQGMLASDPEHQQKKELALIKEDTGKGNVKGLDPADNVPVTEDAHGRLWKNGKQYAGGQLVPVTKAEPTGLDASWLTNWRKSNPSATPEQENAAIVKHQKETGQFRGESFAKSRPVNVYDTKQGNAPKVMSLADVVESNALEPGRYIPVTGSTKAFGQTVLIEDIRGAIQNTRGSLKGLATDFTATQAAQIALVMKQRDPTSATSTFIGSQIGLTLTPDQIDYITDLAQLVENAMAMRSVLGAGQGSDELRDAIRATIPSAKTPSRAFANKQLDKFEQQLNRLLRGVPKVPLRTDVGETETRPEPGGGGGGGKDPLKIGL